MDLQVSSRNTYRFGLFEADSNCGELYRQGVRVKLQEQPFRLLILLLERPGQVVSREELRQQLWPSDTYVEFDGSLNSALKKLRYSLGDSADNPLFVETIPKRGYRFIAPVTGLEREKIPPVAGEVEAAPVARDNATGQPAARWQRAALLTAIFVLAVSALVVSYRRANRERSALLPPVRVVTRPSVAILGFNNASGRVEDAWLSTALSEMLNTELAAGDKLRLVPGEDVAHLRLVSPWVQTGSVGQETASRIGAALSSDVLVLGSYTSVEKSGKRQLRVDVRLEDASTGNILLEVAQTDGEENLFYLASAVGGKLRQKLGLPGDTPEEQAGALALMPSNPEAARFYALGLDKLREFDAQSAKDLFEQAVKCDPKFPLTHAMLALAWAKLGYETKRKGEAKIALDLSGNLPRVERMQVEGSYYESQANHEKAASTYRALFALFPDSVDYGLQLAAAQALASHGSQAQETLAQLRRLPPQVSSDPRIDLAQAKLAHKKPESLALIRTALSKASTRGNKLMYAEARRDECITLVYGEHPEQAIASCEDAYNIFLAAGNRLGAADSVRLIGDQQGSEGHYEPAIATYQRALHTLEGMGEHEKTGAVLNNMAGVFTNEGKLDRGEQLYRQAKSQFEQAGDKANAATALGNIADILYLRGNLPAATNMYQQTIELEGAIDLGDPSYALYRLADLKLAQGRVKDAERDAQRAVDLLRPAEGGYQYLTSAMIVLGTGLELEGNLPGARQQYQEALDIRQKNGEVNLVAESQVSLADLAMEEAHPEHAEPLIRPAIAEFEKEKADPDATSAYTLLSRALQAENKIDEARQAIQHATELGHNSPDPALKLPAAIQTARVEIASVSQSGRANSVLATARQELRSTAATARKLGYYTLECEARLALGELELKANPARGRSLLNDLADEAQGHGLHLIALKASNLATRSKVTADAAQFRSSQTLH